MIKNIRCLRRSFKQPSPVFAPFLGRSWQPLDALELKLFTFFIQAAPSPLQEG